jgi:phenylpropionate dioxygenase-like ring-hydroxylating dioxygenase large terminal subunit
MNTSAWGDVAGKDPYPRGLPPWTYDHPALARLEHQRIFLPSWQIVCHINDIPNPGDFLTFEIGPDSVVALRDRQGAIGVFHNVCRHRAARLVEGRGKCGGAITCPYHGWTYNLDGSLRGLPVRESFPALDRTAHGLLAVRSEIMAGFVFVCLSGDPPDLASLWGEMLGDFVPYSFDQMQPLAPMYAEDWGVDWKVAMDNYLESYHVPVGHPGLARMLTPDYEDQLNLPTGVARGIGWLRPQPSPKWSERLYQQMVEDLTTHLPEANRRCWRFYSMLPNLGIDVYPDQMDFFQVLPLGPGKCRIRGGTYGLPDQRREMRVLRYLNARINRQVQREDDALCRRVQLGLSSSFYQPGPLSTLEVCILQFHDLIRARIPETRLPRPPAEFADVQSHTA